MKTDFSAKNARRKARKELLRRLADGEGTRYTPRPAVVGTMHAIHQAAQRGEQR